MVSRKILLVLVCMAGSSLKSFDRGLHTARARSSMQIPLGRSDEAREDGKGRHAANYHIQFWFDLPELKSKIKRILNAANQSGRVSPENFNRTLENYARDYLQKTGRRQEEIESLIRNEFGYSGYPYRAVYS